MRTPRRINNRLQAGFATGVLVFVIPAVTFVGFIGYRSLHETKDSKATNQEVTRPTESSIPEPQPRPQSSASGFDAGAFYNKVENGMTYQQVKDLAGGKEGDCAQTAVYPPSGNMSCTWSDAKLRVTVHISQDKVISKQKTEL